MRSASQKLYLAMMERSSLFYPTATITFANGKIVNLERKDFMTGGNSITDSAGLSDFPLGVVVGKAIELTLDNTEEQWDDYAFYGARIQLRTNYEFEDGSVESFLIGTFTVVDPVTPGMTITISAIDEAYKLDVDYVSPYSTPLSDSHTVNAGQLFRDICQKLNITPKSADFPNSNFQIRREPEKMTYRTMIGALAAIAGGNAKFDEYNRLAIIPYDFTPFESGLDGGRFDHTTASRYQTGDTADGGSFNPWTTGYVFDGGAFMDRNNINVLIGQLSGQICFDDITITGLQMMEVEKEDPDDNQLFMYGKSGYVLTLENPLVADDQIQSFLGLIGPKICNHTFRPFQCEHTSYPMAEFMDTAIVFDRKGGAYQTVLTDVDFTYAGKTSLKCSAQDPITVGNVSYDSSLAKSVQDQGRINEREKSAREAAIENMLDQIENSPGLYVSREYAGQSDVTGDGAYIYYLHDKKTREESTIVWKITARTFSISTDGGKSFNLAFNADGDMILQRIYAIGIDASHIETGSLLIKSPTSSNIDDALFYGVITDQYGRTSSNKLRINATRNGKSMFLLDSEKGILNITADSFSLSSGATINSIARGEANDVWDKDLTQQQVFNKLTNGGTNEGIWLSNTHLYLNASAIQSGAISIKKGNTETFYADTVTGTVRINADSFSLSGTSLGSYIDNRIPDFKDSWTSASAQDIFNKLTGNGKDQGVYLQNGKLYLNFEYSAGNTLTLGGSNNSKGTLIVNNASGAQIGKWDNTGIDVSSGTIYQTGTFGATEISGGDVIFYTNSGRTTSYRLGFIGRQRNADTRNYSVSAAIDGNAESFAIVARTGTSGTYDAKFCYYNTAPSDSFLAGTLSVEANMHYHVRSYYGSSSDIKGFTTNYSDGVGLFSVGSDSKVYLGTASSRTASGNVKLWIMSNQVALGTTLNLNGNTMTEDSDERLKTNITESDLSALDVMNSIRTYSYDWIESGKHIDLGFIAQQFESEVDADLVNTDEKTDVRSIRVLDMVPYLVKSVQELSQQITDLKTEISVLKGETAAKPLKARRSSWTPASYSMEEKESFIRQSRPEPVEEEFKPREVECGDST